LFCPFLDSQNSLSTLEAKVFRDPSTKPRNQANQLLIEKNTIEQEIKALEEEVSVNDCLLRCGGSKSCFLKKKFG
jgi:hypothetical protein